MKTGLVLGGGGTRGAYQNGAIRALRELGEDHWDIITGTSIGALNAALAVQGDFDAMDELWRTLKQEDIVAGMVTQFDLASLINERNLFTSFFKNYIAEKGADVSPFRKKVDEMYSAERFFASSVDFGCVAVHLHGQKPVMVDKEMMREHGRDWLIASASAFPAFPTHRIDGEEYIDGGYYDNLPVDYAIRKGAYKLIVIDLNHNMTHPQFMDREGIHYIFPQIASSGSFLDFSRDHLDQLDRLGYNDTMKSYGVYSGVGYTFERMELPRYVRPLARQLMILDGRVKMATNINERFRSETVVYDYLRSRQHRQRLKERHVFFGLLDLLMELEHLPVEEVYTYRDVRNRMIKSYRSCLEKDYVYQPTFAVDDMISFFSSLDRKGIIEKFVHMEFYPDHRIVSEGVQLTLYPVEMALAQLIVWMMKELEEV